jgi:hypothetical protein
VTIPVPILTVLLGVILTGLVGLMSWLVRQNIVHAEYLARTSEALKAIKETSVEHGDRIRSLETWQHGVEFGRHNE